MSGGDRIARLLDKRKEVAAEMAEGENKKDINPPFKYIPIENIIPNPKQPRQKFDEESLNELADSIKARGVIQPIKVRFIEENQYMLIAGERRWRASKKARKETIPAYISYNSNDSDHAIDALVENIARENLSAIEKANAIIGIQELHPEMSDVELAKFIGISRIMIYRLLNIHKIPDHMKDIFYLKKLTDRHAKALLMLEKHKELQEELFENLSEKDISGVEAIKMAEEWLKRINLIKTPVTKFYASFKLKISKLQNSKFLKLQEAEKNKMREQINDMKRMLEKLESKLNDLKQASNP